MQKFQKYKTLPPSPPSTALRLDSTLLSGHNINFPGTRAGPDSHDRTLAVKSNTKNQLPYLFFYLKK